MLSQIKEHKLYRLLEQKIKFAIASVIATATDYILYLLFTLYLHMAPAPSNVVSASTGMLINFFLHKRMVFTLQRKAHHAFLLSVAVSVGGIALGTALIYWLTHYPFFIRHQYITKLIATGTVFFYNFYLKRFAFEKKLSSGKPTPPLTTTIPTPEQVEEAV